MWSAHLYVSDGPAAVENEGLILFFNIYLFIWLRRVLVAACGIFSCGMWDL